VELDVVDAARPLSRRVGDDGCGGDNPLEEHVEGYMGEKCVFFGLWDEGEEQGEASRFLPQKQQKRASCGMKACPHSQYSIGSGAESYCVTWLETPLAFKPHPPICKKAHRQLQAATAALNFGKPPHGGKLPSAYLTISLARSLT